MIRFNLPKLLLILIFITLGADGHAEEEKGLGSRRKIALVSLPQNTALSVSIGSLENHGLIPYLVGNAVGKGASFTKAVNETYPDLNLDQDFQKSIVDTLIKRGFTVDVIDPPRDSDGSVDLLKIESNEVEAIVQIAITSGYFAHGPTTDYRRAINIWIKIVDPRRKSIIDSKFIPLHSFPLKGSPPENQYENFERLMADSASAARGLKEFAIGTGASVSANYLQFGSLNWKDWKVADAPK